LICVAHCEELRATEGRACRPEAAQNARCGPALATTLAPLPDACCARFTHRRPMRWLHREATANPILQRENTKAIFMKRGITRWTRIMNPCARMAIEIMKQPSPQAPIAICILWMLHGRLCHINESEDAPCSVCFPRSLIHRRAMVYSR